MKSLHAIVLGSAVILLGPAAMIEPALARGQVQGAQLDQTSGGETRVAQRKGKKKVRDKARGRTSARGKREGSKARPAARPPTPAAADDEAADSTPIVSTRTAPARVDFDERLVQGQSSKSGAIYIFERKGAELRTMVRRRQSFREEILRTVE